MLRLACDEMRRMLIFLLAISNELRGVFVTPKLLCRQFLLATYFVVEGLHAESAFCLGRGDQLT